MMLFGQKTHPLNFDYAQQATLDSSGVRLAGVTFQGHIHCYTISEGCLRLDIDNDADTDLRRYSDGILENYRNGEAVAPTSVENGLDFATETARIELRAGQLRIQFASGVELSTTRDGIGGNGPKTVLNWQVDQASGFYGFGERTKRLNKSGDSLDFWNIDVIAVMEHNYQRDDFDPAYVAVPLVILKQPAGYCGLYFDNPERSVIDVEKIRPGILMVQSMTGPMPVYLLDGPSLRDVVRRFTRLTGYTELPPLWALGYHQCRYSYMDEAEIRLLQQEFARHDLPVSALWYDIHYMDGYRVFTWNRHSFPDAGALNRELKQQGIRTVAIIDPGVKHEAGNPVYDSGRAQNVFCKTASGQDYVGQVWPGDSVFPDFPLSDARDWWAENIARFLEDSALDGLWLDMNDPATGYSTADDMLFENGTVAHGKYHNQYAHLMAKASHAGFERLDPQRRPFLLTRSAWTGTQRYSAVWTGDNVSNWQHLRMSIPCTLNLGLSGIPFNGPDVGGFMGHTSAELLIRWYQAGFLFPFFRNHSELHSKNQEPWQFGETALAAVRATLYTRYRLLPYIYNCFFEHYLTGDPILRPLLYEYDDPLFENLDDQFLLGDALLAAPILHGGEHGRSIVQNGRACNLRFITLPPGWWFDLNLGLWAEGGTTLSYAVALDETPLFVRDGAIIPYYNGPIGNGEPDLSKLELHCFLKQCEGRLDYYVDDRKTRAYRDGQYNTVRITARRENAALHLTLDEQGNKPQYTVQFRPVLYGAENLQTVEIAQYGGVSAITPASASRYWLGKSLRVFA